MAPSTRGASRRASAAASGAGAGARMDCMGMAPTAAKWTSLVVAFLAAALYFYAHVHRESGEAWARYVEIITKPVPVLACMVVVLTRDVAPHAVRYARFVVIGLGFSVLGDVCLLFASLFLPGVAFFLIGHIMFVFAFRSGVRLPRSVLLYMPFALHACGIAYFVTPHTEDAIMATASIVYTLVIGFMSYSAWSRVGVKSERLVSQLIGALGAAFFMTSDTLLAVDRWVTPIEGQVSWVMVTYWLAQSLIAVSVPRHVRK